MTSKEDSRALKSLLKAMGNHIKKMEEELKELRGRQFEEIDEDALATVIREDLESGQNEIHLNRHEAYVVLNWYDALNG